MNHSSIIPSGRTRRTTAIALLVSGVAIATAFASSDLDAFTDALQTVAQRYAGTVTSVDSTPSAILASVARPDAGARSTPTVGISVAVVKSTTPVVAPTVAPLLLHATASARSNVAASPARPSTPARAVAGPSVATEYHLPTPSVAGRHDEPAFPSFHTTAVADDDGRTIELADAAPAVARVLPRVATEPSTPPVTPADVATPRPTPVVTPAADPSSPSTSVAVISRGRGAVDAPVSVVGAGLPDADGWVPSAGVQPDGAPGELAWETVVDTGHGLGSGGVRGATTPGWTPGTGEIQDVRVNADGSITVLPEPTSLLAVASACVLPRRRRR